MKSLVLLLLLVVASLAIIPNNMNGVALGAITAGSSFCNAFPTNPEYTGWRHDPVYDNFLINYFL